MAIGFEQQESIARRIASEMLNETQGNMAWLPNQKPYRKHAVLGRVLRELPLIESQDMRAVSLALVDRVQWLLQNGGEQVPGFAYDTNRQMEYDMVSSLREETYIANTPFHKRVRDAFVEQAGNVIGKMSAVF